MLLNIKAIKMCEFSVKYVNVQINKISLQITVDVNRGDIACGSAQ